MRSHHWRDLELYRDGSIQRKTIICWHKAWRSQHMEWWVAFVKRRRVGILVLCDWWYIINQEAEQSQEPDHSIPPAALDVLHHQHMMQYIQCIQSGLALETRGGGGDCDRKYNALTAIKFWKVYINFWCSILCRIVGLPPVFTKQALLNRQNPKVYTAFANILGVKVCPLVIH